MTTSEPPHVTENGVDLAVYLIAALVLIGLGMWLTSWVLNWIVGPALIVTIVVTLTPIAHRLRGRSGRAGSVGSGGGRVSWAAHELESYVLAKHLKVRISYIAILAGCLLPDLFTKLPVYGFHIGSLSFKASDAHVYHRGWPGVGPTHSLMFGVLIAALVLWATKSQAWSLGLLIGHAAHVLTDVFDSVGTMVLFPFTTQHYTTGMWAYAAQQGRYGDAAAYYGSLGGVWDFFWLLVVLSGFRVLSASYFFTTIAPYDGVWTWLRRTFRLSDTAMLALYRCFFVYGASRIFSWFLWARLVKHAPLDFSWGGPFWVEKVSSHYGPWTEVLANTIVGIGGFTLTLIVLWRLVGRRLWARATRDPAALPMLLETVPG